VQNMRRYLSIIAWTNLGLSIEILEKQTLDVEWLLIATSTTAKCVQVSRSCSETLLILNSHSTAYVVPRLSHSKLSRVEPIR
jgi:hypothetical protein